MAFHRLAVEVCDHHVGGGHLLVGNAAGFDDAEAVLAGDRAGIAEGEDYESAADQIEIGFKHFGA